MQRLFLFSALFLATAMGVSAQQSSEQIIVLEEEILIDATSPKASAVNTQYKQEKPKVFKVQKTKDGKYKLYMEEAAVPAQNAKEQILPEPYTPVESLSK